MCQLTYEYCFELKNFMFSSFRSLWTDPLLVSKTLKFILFEETFYTIFMFLLTFLKELTKKSFWIKMFAGIELLISHDIINKSKVEEQKHAPFISNLYAIFEHWMPYFTCPWSFAIRLKGEFSDGMKYPLIRTDVLLFLHLFLFDIFTKIFWSLWNFCRMNRSRLLNFVVALFRLATFCYSVRIVDFFFF